MSGGWDKKLGGLTLKELFALFHIVCEPVSGGCDSKPGGLTLEELFAKIHHT